MMDKDLQFTIVSALATNRQIMASLNGIVKPSYFDPTLKKSVAYLKEYYEKYSDVPTPEIFAAVTKLTPLDFKELDKGTIEFIIDNAESHCRQSAVTEAILKGPDLIEAGSYEVIIKELQDALLVGVQKEMGMDYFTDPYARLQQTLVVEQRIPLGIPQLDAALGGGMNRQELLLFLANSGGGKSMTKLNVCNNWLASGLNGIYVSLEMAEGVVSKRLDQMISGIPADKMFAQMDMVAEFIMKAAVKYGKFKIKRFPENRTTASDISSYLQHLKRSTGFDPDFIAIDYIDITGSSTVKQVENMFVKDKFVTEEIRALGFDYNALMLSSSQLGRTAIEVENLNQSHIQGGMSKINTTDYAVAIRQTDMMRAAGEIEFQILKSRNSDGTGKKIITGWDPVSLRIVDKTDSFKFTKKEPQVQGPSSRHTLFNKLKNNDTPGDSLLDQI